MDSLRGQLLIAPPHLGDPNFAKAVVLIVQHNTEGAFGLVLNRPSSKGIDEIWEEHRGRRCARQDRLHVGGPVPGPLLLLHGDPLAGDIEILDGVYCCSSADELEARVDDDGPLMRFYWGYSGWGEGQLEGELQTGSWITTSADAEHIFHRDGADLWKAVWERIVDDTSLPDGFAPQDDEPNLN